MGHMEVDFMVGSGQIAMTRLDIADSWILRIREVMDIGAILVLVLTGTMIIIFIIVTGEVIGDICGMSLRELSHLLLLEI